MALRYQTRSAVGGCEIVQQPDDVHGQRVGPRRRCKRLVVVQTLGGCAGPLDDRVRTREQEVRAKLMICKCESSRMLGKIEEPGITPDQVYHAARTASGGLYPQ